ncbi:MAG: hypothetical protein K6E99_05105 [Bacilli bacterium]|nr:hypothetical protein [Bacilli bacterium]
MEDFYVEDLSRKEIIFKVFITLIIVGCAVVLGIYLIGANSLHIKKEIKIEVGNTLSKKVSDYVTGKLNNTTEYTIKVDGLKLGEVVEKTGEYKYTVKYNHQIKEGKIIVIDTKAPEVTTQDVTIGPDDDYELDDFIKSCNDYSKPCKVTLKDDKDYTEVGIYNLTLIIEDQSGNKTEKTASLTIKEGYSLKEVKESNLNIASTEPAIEDFKDEYAFIKFDKAYENDDESEAYNYMLELITEDLNKYIPSEYAGATVVDQETIELLNKYGYVVGYAFKVKLSNGEETYLKNNQES